MHNICSCGILVASAIVILVHMINWGNTPIIFMRFVALLPVHCFSPLIHRKIAFKHSISEFKRPHCPFVFNIKVCRIHCMPTAESFRYMHQNLFCWVQPPFHWSWAFLLFEYSPLLIVFNNKSVNKFSHQKQHSLVMCSPPVFTP